MNIHSSPATPLRHETQSSEVAASASYKVAHLHYLRGEYRKALELYRLSRRQCEETGNLHYYALCDLDESDILLELNKVTEAGQLAQRAAMTFGQVGFKYERAKATVNFAVACFRRGDSSRAHKLFHEARKWFAREENRYWRAILDLYQATVFAHDGDKEKARRYVERALAVLAHSPLGGKLALCHSLLARLSIGERNFDAARQHLSEMEKLVYSPALRFQFHYLRGALHEQSGEPDAAADDYAAAITQIEDPRRGFWVEELKIPFLEDKTEVFAAAIRLSLEGRTVGGRDAFSWVSHAKSKSSLEPSSDLPQIAELKRDLTVHHRLLVMATETSRMPNSDRLRAFRSRIEESEQQLLRLTTAQPRDFLATKVMQERLPEDAALVEFFPVGERIHAWVLMRNSLVHVAGEPIGPTREAVRLLQFQLSKPQPGQAAKAHLRELYAALIEPIRGLLRGSRIIFAPWGFLHHVPFDELIDEAGQSLSTSFTVSYAPSASLETDAQPLVKRAVYRRGAYCIDLCAEAEPNSIRTSLVGQIADAPMGDIPVALMAGKRILEQKSCNGLGEFVLEFVSSRRLRVKFDLRSEGLAIEVSLKDLVAS